MQRKENKVSINPPPSTDAPTLDVKRPAPAGDLLKEIEALEEAQKQEQRKKQTITVFICCCGDPNCYIGPFTIPVVRPAP